MSKCSLHRLPILLLLLLVTNLSAQSDSNQIKIAFMGLVSRGSVTDGQSEIVTDLLMAEIINTGTFELVERQELDSIFKEMKLQQSGFLDTASDTTMIEFGKFAAVKLLLMGSIGELENKTAITVRLVDAESAKIIFANTLVSRPNELSDGLRVLAREISRSGIQSTMEPSMEKIEQARVNDQPREALMLARKMMEIETSPEIVALVTELKKETAWTVYKEAKRALRKSAWDNAVILADEAVLLDPDPIYVDFRFKALSKREEAHQKEAMKKEKMQRSEEERREREAAGLFTFGDHVKNYYNGIEPGGFHMGYVSGMELDDQQYLNEPFAWPGGEFGYTRIASTGPSWVYKAWSVNSVLSTQEESDKSDKNFVLNTSFSPWTTWYFGGGNLFFSPSFDAGIILMNGPSLDFAYGGSTGIQGTLEFKFYKTIGFYSSIRLEYDWVPDHDDKSGIRSRWSTGITL